VTHFAGIVHYDITAFLEKNRDTFSHDLLNVVSGSKFKFLLELFNETIKTGTETTKKSRTLAAQFKGSLDALMKTLGMCNPFFVRCVKVHAAATSQQNKMLSPPPLPPSSSSSSKKNTKKTSVGLEKKASFYFIIIISATFDRLPPFLSFFFFFFFFFCSRTKTSGQTTLTATCARASCATRA
jgi:hypothetical protein